MNQIVILIIACFSCLTYSPVHALTGFIFAKRSDLSLDAGQYSDLLNTFRDGSDEEEEIVVNEIDKLSSVVKIRDAINQMIAQNVDSIYIGCHGMGEDGGCTSVQHELAAAHYSNEKAVKGLVLINGFLTRDKRPDLIECAKKEAIKPTRSFKCPGGCLEDGVHTCAVSDSPVSFPVPVLTIGGELDGIVRVTRIAEAYYTQQNQPKFPVVAVKGMSHLSILNYGTEGWASSKIRNNDLKATVSHDTVVNQVSSMIKKFISATNSNNGYSALKTEINLSAELFAPFLDAFVVQEGNWFFTGNDDESGSSLWAAEAQQHMLQPLPSGVESLGDATNEFRLLSDEDKIPPYFRPMHRPQIDADTLATNTVAQLRFVKVSLTDVAVGLNGFGIIKEEKNAALNKITDDGFGFVSAIEIATKLKSRQYFFDLVKASEGNDPSLDDGSKCQEINQKALDWALSKLSPDAYDRYMKYGKKIVLGVDIKSTPSAGPFFIWKYISYEETATELKVVSPFAFFPLDSNPYGAGNHYCKLLSPARALEYMSIDSLRPSKSAKTSLRLVESIFVKN